MTLTEGRERDGDFTYLFSIAGEQLDQDVRSGPVGADAVFRLRTGRLEGTGSQSVRRANVPRLFPSRRRQEEGVGPSRPQTILRVSLQRTC